MTCSEILNLLYTNEWDIQKANAILFACDLVFNAYVNSDAVHKINFSPVFCYMPAKGSSPFYQILPQKPLEEISKKIYQNYKKNPESFTNYIGNMEKIVAKLDKIWAKHQKNNSHCDLLTTYQQLVTYGQKWWHYALSGEDKGAVISLEIIPAFSRRHHISYSDAEKIFNVLSHPKEQSILNLERKCFLELCLLILGNKNFNNALRQKKYDSVLADKKVKKIIHYYLKNYFWIKTDYCRAEKITPKKLLLLISSELKNNQQKILAEHQNITLSHTRLQKEKEKYLSEIKLSREDKADIKFAQTESYLIDLRKLHMMKQCFYLFSFLAELAEKFNLPYEELSTYRVNEIKSLLSHQIFVPQREVKWREKGAFLSFERGKECDLFFGKDAASLLERVKNTREKGLKGMVASYGKKKKIQGIARVIFDPLHEEFKEGEILITSMTRVEFIPLMRRALAVVTDEGGIACHAAIVSRELNKPCIIGTKSATRILKSGNRIELDMTTGEVKLL